MDKRKTRKQKVKAGFRVKFGELEADKNPVAGRRSKVDGGGYFRADLTKVLILTMLALASEFAIWFILKR